MANLTSNISSVNLTVSGNTQQSTTISWTLPSIPSSAVISSCTLTGTATASMSKGSATIKVNGTTVSSGSSFTIDLGTSNTTSSVSATVVGGNKNASGTVTFSNLVYTVTYTVNITYTVTFVDYDGSILKTETVPEGGSATAPEVNRDGYSLIGWSVDFSNVISNITTTAQYKAINVLRIKENNDWIKMSKIYKKISGNWFEQVNDDWVNLFETNTKYKRREIPFSTTATLYSDGSLVFSNNNDSSHGDIVKVFTGWDTEIYDYPLYAPWYDYKDNITSVYINNIKPQSTQYFFYQCGNMTRFNISGFDTSDVTSMSNMFNGCDDLTLLDLSSFNTKNVTNMYRMFYYCHGLTSLNLSSFDTRNVTDMSGMFWGCHSLTSLDLSNFDTRNVTDMDYMFQSCAFTSLDLSNFDTRNVTRTSRMFCQCDSLASLDLSSFDFSNINYMSDMFSDCTNRNLTIYVKDETAKTKIESSSNFPTTATVVIGKPS